MNKFNVPVTFKSLAQHLQNYGFEQHLDEITYHILYSKVDAKDVHITNWSIEQFCDWIYSLEFIGNEAKRRKVAKVLLEEEIDGFTFMELTETDWVKHLNLDLPTFLLLLCIRNGWTLGWKQPIEVPKGVPAGVATGIMADLSVVSTEIARALVEADSECVETGKGLYYGQLVVLGYREYHIDGEGFQPVGQSNEKYVLRRRRIPNGLAFVTGARATTATHKIKYSSRISRETMTPEEGSGVDTRPVLRQGEFFFGSDPTCDQFQLGRLVQPHNDFVIKGPLHYDQGGQQCGPVSRLACRIVCSRVAPFRCFLLAGGFSADKVSCLFIYFVQFSLPHFSNPSLRSARWC